MKASKLNNKIDIMIEDDLSTKNLSLDSKIDDKNKYKDWRQILSADNKHVRLPLLMAIMNKPDNSVIEKLYNLCIKSKHIKIDRYKNMISTTKKPQEIHNNL